MKINTKELKRTVKEAVIPAGITLFVFFAVLLIKGIYPFGELRIDYYDMGQTNAPLYYHIWDFLHGKGSLFYSWYIDGGQNLSMGSSIQWNISVFNLFFLFIKRASVMRALSVFMGIHLFFMAFNMDVFLRRAVNTTPFYRILFSIAYGLTGYTLTHYTIPTYLDTAALMPLYLLTLYEALKPEEEDEKCINPVLIYALMTGYMTALGYYMAFMNLIFILLVSGTYVFVLCGKDCDDKAKRKAVRGRAATRLGIGTFAGIGLSCFMLIPAAMQMTHSSRFNSNLSGGLFETLHDILWAIGADMYYIKWWLLSGSILAIVIVLSGLIRFRSEKRISLFIFLFCMYPCALIVFESVNLLWHMGTYYHYPIRCGYLIPIVLLTSAAYYTGRIDATSYVNRDDKTSPGDSRRSYVNRENNADSGVGNGSYVNLKTMALTITSLTASVSGVLVILYYLRHEVWQVEELFKAWVIFAAVLGAVYILIWCVIRKPAFSAPVLMTELIVTAFIGYGQPHFIDRFSSDPEQSGEYVVMSQQILEDLSPSESRTDRIKNPDTTLNTNYGFILRRATVGGWANTVPRDQLDAAVSMGYGAHFMRILDCGGTLLSDAALHVTETLTTAPELYTQEAFEEEGEADGYTLFKNKYILPFVIPVDNGYGFSLKAAEAVSEYDVCRMTNALYELLIPGGLSENADSGIMRE
ncbi:MAG: YfhO family protein, partial [Lachnospiraceae bacterium]|nr:YfhO family protein [Lachnospiraceae bacterium]